MKERIKELRKKLGLNQVEFSKQINVGASTLAMFETGDRIPKDIHVSQICAIFNVNEEWLREGIGEIFLKPSGMTLDEYAKSRNLTDVEFEIIRAYMELPEDFRKMAMEKLAAIFERHRKANPTDFWAEAPETSAELEKAYPVDGPSKKTDEVG